MTVHICSFDGVGPVPVREKYCEFRERVLKAGRFSAFEATANQRTAKLYDQLERDPEVETDRSQGFPWVAVRKRSQPVDKPRYKEGRAV
jgi:hypothetical protein